ncbi:uncharacterized protein PAC_11088 [Phialocephala subalpina]|uniref:Uncharacterized protein n=1 Tax=Phialocephala subalpina TaxID=576137 RepID=A0A1L7X851_9HELO|nr:uncharacterized protein PAC_11088 [Phialocephala subalpina]
MARSQTLLIALLSSSKVTADAIIEARNPYYGGFALPGTAADGAVHGCPSGTLTCSNEVFTFCCPNFTFCGPFQEGPYCCPTSDDCGSILGAGLTCADPSWTLYQDAFDWCCTNDTVGLALADGECQPASMTYSSAEYANTVVQANTAAPPTNWPGGTVPPGVSTSFPATATDKSTKTSAGAQTTSTATGTSTSTAAGSTKTSGSDVGRSISVVVEGLVGAGSVLAVLLL